MKNRQPKNRKQIFDEEGIKRFGKQLKKLRNQEGISQNQLAFESGLSLSQIARIETAQINPTLSTVFVIARTLNISLPELFNFELPQLKSPEDL
jgi:transcriptional regulator with XRE-family HTH domain